MKKVFHNQLHDWAVPKNPTKPIYVLSYCVSFSEIEEVVEQHLKNLAPFNGFYSLHVEFTEPNQDPEFVLGHASCIISIYAESEDLRDEMLVVLGV